MVIVLLFLAVGGIGCNYSRYSVVVRNETEQGLSDVEVSWGRHKATPGFISPRSAKYHAFPNAPFPGETQVRWRTPDGVLHEQRVDVRSDVGWHTRLASTDLVFAIQTDGSILVTLEDPE